LMSSGASKVTMPGNSARWDSSVRHESLEINAFSAIGPRLLLTP
jgi:hypothetical protein